MTTIPEEMIMDKKLNMQICKENSEILQKNGYILDGQFIRLPHTLKEQQRVSVFSPEYIQGIVDDEDEFFERAFCASKECHIKVKNIDSFAEPTDLVMNFASATHPGGGYLRGSNAQEEALCRQSSLYASLTAKAAREMYDFNIHNKDVLYSDYMLLSPKVDVFRSSSLKLLAEPFTTAVMSIPAPNLRGRAQNVPLEEVLDIMEDRIRNYLYCAARFGYRNITLGAWGCGAFGHDAKLIAHLFRNVIVDDMFHEFFDSILFAVLDKSRDKYNYLAFRDTFADIPVLKRPNYASEVSQKEGSCLDFEPYFILASKPMPICNHTECVNKDNIGYCQGLLEDGTPFEAELYKAGDEEGLVVIMPRLFLQEKPVEEFLENNAHGENNIKESKVAYLTGQKEYTDNSILWIGMVFNNMEEDLEIIKSYVGCLKDYGIIRYLGPMENCAVFYCTDIAGNDLVKLNITLKDATENIAETSLRFTPFRESKKDLFKIIK